ncbi:ribonuclease H-like protein [Apiospora arundinis]|uniref:Ribonuclease H-like domain-containing protein n=1 Tax=Apiospora arundinis TaxID=335852 RepID=A0ABR2J792_9PEZI
MPRQYPCDEECQTPCTVKHIVLKTDSAYLVNGITSYINKWRHNGWKTSSGTDVKNRDLWEWLERLVDEYLDLGVAVDFWLVRREHNKEADTLANLGLISNLTLTMEGGFNHNLFWR